MTGLKLILTGSLLVIGLVGLLTMRFKAFSSNRNLLSYTNCFSAGMFLAIALVHIMPESVEEFSHYAEEHELEEPFPLPYCMMFAGYILVLMIDRVIISEVSALQRTKGNEIELSCCGEMPAVQKE